MAVTVTSVAPADLLADVARRAAALADELEAVRPRGRPGARRPASPSDPVRPDRRRLLAAAMPFDVVIGSCNPVALPITIEFDPPKAIGRAEFTAPYEGAPGCVHGAVLAGAFDIMLTAANVIADGAGPTVNLSIRYLKPTLVGRARAVRVLGDRAGRPPHPQPRPSHPERGGHGGGGRRVRQHGAGPDRGHAPSGTSATGEDGAEVAVTANAVPGGKRQHSLESYRSGRPGGRIEHPPVGCTTQGESPP